MSKTYTLENDNGFRPHIIHVRPRLFTRRWLQPLEGQHLQMTKKRTNDNKPDVSYGGITIAYSPVFIKEANGDVKVFVEYGYAVCSGLDRYVKKTGREIAEKFLANQGFRAGMFYVGKSTPQCIFGSYEEALNQITDGVPLVGTPNGLYVFQKTFPLDWYIQERVLEQEYPEIYK